MEQKIFDTLNGNAPGKYILPFFWQHGEELELLKEEIDAIQKCGITEMCIESRTHEQFGEDKWWDDFGFILEEAERRNMRVWLLDDKHFPTGYANNYIEKHPELRMTYLRCVFFDYSGPQNDVAILPPDIAKGSEEEIISVVAYRRTVNGNVISGEGIQLVQNISDGLLWWDIPEGIWRIHYVIRTKCPFAQHKTNYINMLSPESCKAMIHAVYQPHYERYSKYFGNTFAGFFSDEPSFGNGYGYEIKLGTHGILIPWDNALPEILGENANVSADDIMRLLPALWYDGADRTPLIRETYMDTITRIYSRNFGYMLGDWCRERGVLYIGHVIEDMNTHQRLGYGAGNFFRALDGQDMAGIDVVLHQIIPGHTEIDHTAPCSGGKYHPEFFNYTLAKLASSHAHIQPLKKGRAMCEIFGAFGWAESLSFMKYLTDHMLVNGINHFVPHAFTPKRDDSAPPHFYVGGKYYHYPLFAKLMEYMKNTAHVLTDGIHVADVAVYYNAEAEWAGGNYMLQQKICKLLTRNQIDFDFIPQDYLCDNVTVKDGRIALNEETYGAMIVPYSQYLPECVINAFETLSKNGARIIFADALPEKSTKLIPVGDRLSCCTAIPYDGIIKELEKLNLRSMFFDKSVPSVRFYHIKRGGSDIFMFWNEDIYKKADFKVTLPASGKAVIYYVWHNTLLSPEQDGSTVRILLEGANAVILCVGEENGQYPPYDYNAYDYTDLCDLKWDISLRLADDKEFTLYRKNSELFNISRHNPTFSGAIRYEAVWTPGDADKIKVIDLGTVGETAELYINGEKIGSEIASPFRFNVAGKLTNGENRLTIDVMNNVAYSKPEYLSRYIPFPPGGLIGPVKYGK
ncbi:MAG: hypothetical protein IJO52_05120 [Clostridia bacterium]|nr:hypothetical protein [Clostridia bacterium]